MILFPILSACRPEPSPQAHRPDLSTPTPAPTPLPEPTSPIEATVVHAASPASVLSHRFTITLTKDVAVSLRCTSPDDPAEDHLLEAPGATELRLYGLLASTTYQCVLTDDRARTLWAGEFTTDALPEGFPEFVVSGSASDAVVDDGYLLISHWRFGPEDRKYRVLAVDGAGRARWYVDLPEAVAGGIATSWTGDQLVVGGGGVRPSLRNLDGEVSFQVPPPELDLPLTDIYNHEAALTPAGVLSLQSVYDTDGTVTWYGFRIEVVDPTTGALNWSFDSRDAVAAGTLPAGTSDDEDVYHVNAVQWRDDDPDGPSVWVSMRSLDQIVRIDRTTGALSVVGRSGPHALVDASGATLPLSEWFYGQHAPLATGNELLVYDNGSGQRGGYASRVASYRLDSATQATLQWAWTEPDWYEPNWGSVTRLPNDHVLVSTGHCNYCAGTGGNRDTGWLLELDPAEQGRVVWRLDFASSEDTLYRASFVGGCDWFANRRFCATP